MTHTPAYQLPTQVSPQRYAIRLTPDLRAFTFDGEETVDITVHEPVTEIVLNAIELTIHSVSASGPDGQTLDGTVSLDSEQERASFHFPQPLAPGAWTLGSASAVSSTTNCTAFTAAPTPRPTARRRSWPRPSLNPPTPAARFRAGTSRRSRRFFR